MGKEQHTPIRVSVKLTLCAEEKFFGPGVCELLERIRKTGSIQAAAAEMEMSYSKAWKILKRAEQVMGEELTTRISGGRNGGSSTLTEAGEEAVRVFREIETKVSEYAGDLLKASKWGENTIPDSESTVE